MTAERVAIVGAGLTGSLLACFLARRGLTVALYERRPDPRVGQPERGRSINLAISERGLDALRRIDLVDQVMADALPMKGRMIHPVEGALDFQQYSASGARAINSISRGTLNNALLDAATQAPGVEVHFEHRLLELDSQGGRMVFETPAGKVEEHADVVLVDSAPLVPVGDAVPIANAVDGVLLVVKLGESRRDELRRALKLLGTLRSKVIGVVITNAERPSDKYEYYSEKQPAPAAPSHDPLGPRRPGRRPAPRFEDRLDDDDDVEVATRSGPDEEQ